LNRGEREENALLHKKGKDVYDMVGRSGKWRNVLVGII